MSKKFKQDMNKFEKNMTSALPLKRKTFATKSSNRIYLKRKKIASVKFITKHLAKNHYINAETLEILKYIEVTTNELAQRPFTILNGRVVRKRYSSVLRRFALALNFYSPKAYQYVRNTFQTCLPSIKTICKWYQNENGQPGFTKEAFKTLKNKADLCKDELICTLMVEEFQIEESCEYIQSAQRLFGYINFGVDFKSDCIDECKEAVVFLVVGMNKTFKVPIGYFLTYAITAEQKFNLVQHAIRLCYESKVTIKALTLGHNINTSMAKILGCSLEPDNLQTSFKHPITNANIFLFFDAIDLLMYVRYAFEGYNILYDSKGRKVQWEYIKKLQKLQGNIRSQLVRKMQISQMEYKKNIVNATLAAQIFTRSFSTALQLCKNNLYLPEFHDVDATSEMILLFNDLIDILDSKVNGYGFKKALDCSSKLCVFERLDECKTFLLNATIKKNNKVIKLINSDNHGKGFRRLCAVIESVKGMYNDLIAEQNSSFKSVSFHKTSLNHIQIFFETIRSHSENNRLLTSYMFESSYNKILTHTAKELGPHNMGIVSLEQISILSCLSSMEKINLTTTVVEDQGEEEDEFTNPFLCSTEIEKRNARMEKDLNNGKASIKLSQFTENPIEYVAGYVASSLIKQLKCKTCVRALVNLNEDKRSFIAYRDKDDFIWPSQNVIKICRRCDFIIRRTEDNIDDHSEKIRNLVNKTLSSFVGEQLFSEISLHQIYSEETNHVIDLASSVMHKYISAKVPQRFKFPRFTLTLLF